MTLPSLLMIAAYISKSTPLVLDAVVILIVGPSSRT